MTRAIGRITPNGGTAMYDAVLEAIPLAATGRNPKKAILLISDGNDTASVAGLRDVRQAIRQSEVLVYAIGIDGESSSRLPPGADAATSAGAAAHSRGRDGGPHAGRRTVSRVLCRCSGSGRAPTIASTVAALRDMTDDSGGRTEIIRDRPRSRCRRRRASPTN